MWRPTWHCACNFQLLPLYRPVIYSIGLHILCYCAIRRRFSNFGFDIDRKWPKLLDIASSYSESWNQSNNRISRKSLSHNVTLRRYALKRNILIQIGALDDDANYKLIATGTNGVEFRNETTLTVQTKRESVFIQSDKAMYKPGDKVQFRVVVVDKNLNPATIGNMDIFVTVKLSYTNVSAMLDVFCIILTFLHQWYAGRF